MMKTYVTLSIVWPILVLFPSQIKGVPTLLELANDSFQQQQKEFMPYVTKCESYYYNLDLSVDTFLFIIARPNEDGINDGCVPMLFGALPPESMILSNHVPNDDVEEGDLQKFAMVVKSPDLLLRHKTIRLSSSESSSSSSRQLYDIMKAFDHANMAIGSRGMDDNNNHHHYGIDFVVDMASTLGEMITPEINRFIAQNLLDQLGAQKMTASIPQNNNNNRNHNSDFDMVEYYVEAHTLSI